MSESSDNDDPVLRSIAAYGNDPIGYERHYAERKLDRPLRFAALLPDDSRILDVGCGPGRDLRVFRSRGHRPTGVELNPSFVAMARQHGEVVVADLRELSTLFAPSSFEGVWAQASLVHLSAEETRRVLRDLHALLVAGGWLYACVAATGETGWKDEPDGRRWYTVWPERTFATAVQEAGFDVVEVSDGVYIELWARRRQ